MASGSSLERHEPQRVVLELGDDVLYSVCGDGVPAVRVHLLLRDVEHGEQRCLVLVQVRESSQ